MSKNKTTAEKLRERVPVIDNSKSSGPSKKLITLFAVLFIGFLISLAIKAARDGSIVASVVDDEKAAS